MSQETPKQDGAPQGAPKKKRVVTSVTVHHRAHEKAETEVLAPGAHSLPADVADDLIARGHAVLESDKAAADAETAAKAEGKPTVTKVKAK